MQRKHNNCHAHACHVDEAALFVILTATLSLAFEDPEASKAPEPAQPVLDRLKSLYTLPQPDWRFHASPTRFDVCEFLRQSCNRQVSVEVNPLESQTLQETTDGCNGILLGGSQNAIGQGTLLQLTFPLLADLRFQIRVGGH
jgi:hypothetical protein